MINLPRLNGPRWRSVWIVGVAVAMALPLGSCANKKEKKAPAVPPPPTFTGPTFLHGSVGSLTSLRGYEPLLVSGYGLVVGLNNTGSGGSPAFLRQWLLNEMRRKGVGSLQLRGVLNATPEQLLASTETAPIVIEGFIPAGAVKGTRFDVLVSALPQTQTTSLQGGQLWTSDLAVDGASPDLRFSRPLARAGGPMYINPFIEGQASEGERPDQERQGVVLAGGITTADRLVELVLNQPSADRSRMVANRINERFPHEKLTQTFNTAQATNDQVIKINIPAQWGGRTDEFLQLISHLFLQRAPDFEPDKAQEMGDLLAVEPKYAERVIYAWVSLGKTAIPVIRRFQTHPAAHVRIAALEAGARLGDERTAEGLVELAKSADPAQRRGAAELLVHLPVSERGSVALRGLLDDDDRSVRIAAYESMARSGDPLLYRVPIGSGADFKFVLDLIPSEKPLIYITQAGVPRIAIFGPNLGFTTPTVARIWDNRLMVRVDSDPKAATSVYYQSFGDVEGKTYTIAPTVGNLIRLLSHKPTARQPNDGLDMSYGRVCSAVYLLSKQGAIRAPVEVRVSALAEAIIRAREEQPEAPRPESAGPPAPLGETSESGATPVAP